MGRKGGREGERESGGEKERKERKGGGEKEREREKRRERKGEGERERVRVRERGNRRGSWRGREREKIKGKINHSQQQTDGAKETCVTLTQRGEPSKLQGTHFSSRN